jgi:hypothetical protein
VFRNVDTVEQFWRAGALHSDRFILPLTAYSNP